jgi:hypothetical protein
MSKMPGVPVVQDVQIVEMEVSRVENWRVREMYSPTEELLILKAGVCV